ncbi:hypothetical protein KSP40_PGU000487 [Platanthera guangdongensis]|uniref:Uncharacterized protein n=1 Tax=Platanthera guangdongensis TaxID=2320717 RepID=A0ABR2M778_9ASPA
MSFYFRLLRYYVVNIQVVLVPVTAGLLLNTYAKPVVNVVQPIISFVAMFCDSLCIGSPLAINKSRILSSEAPPIADSASRALLGLRRSPPARLGSEFHLPISTYCRLPISPFVRLQASDFRLLARAAKTPRNYILHQTNVYESAQIRKLKSFMKYRNVRFYENIFLTS